MIDCPVCGREFNADDEGELIVEEGCAFLDCAMEIQDFSLGDSPVSFPEDNTREYEPDFFDELDNDE